MEERIYHKRLINLLFNTCSSLVRELLPFLIRNHKDHANLSVNDFVQKKTCEIKKTRIGLQNKKTLFPTRTRSTDIQTWDLQLLCFIVCDILQPEQIIKLDVDFLRRIRNELCHGTSTYISRGNYEQKLKMIKEINGRLLQLIGDENFTEEISTQTEDIINDRLNFTEALNILQDWFEEDKTLQLERCNFTAAHRQAIDTLKSQGTAETNMNIPDTKLVIKIENCIKEQEDQICRDFVDAVNAKRVCIEGIPSQTDIENTTMSNIIDETFKEFLGDGLVIVNAELGCVIITIESRSFKSLEQLWTKCVDGELTRKFKTLQTYLREKYQNEVEIEVILPEFEFWEVIDKIAVDLRAGLPEGTSLELPEPVYFKENALEVPLRSCLEETVMEINIRPPSVKGTEIEMILRPQTQEHLEYMKAFSSTGKLRENIQKMSKSLEEQLNIENLKIKSTFSILETKKQNYDRSIGKPDSTGSHPTSSSGLDYFSRHSGICKAKLEESTDCVEKAPKLSEEDIDEMNLPKVFKLCKHLKIPIIGSNLAELKGLLKGELLCSKTLEQITKEFQNDTDEVSESRTTLASLFEEAANELDRAPDAKKGIDEDLKQRGYTSSDELRKKKLAVEKEKAPILILGETGGGKSSFINLLLGEKWLPISILSNTHVVCEIMYGENPKAILTGRNSAPTCIDCTDKEEFRKELAYHVQMVTKNGLPYDKAEILLPCEILKAGLVIVDSPGIGENEEMQEMVLNYATSACAFIFMIDLLVAGGLLQRMDMFLREMYKKAMHDQKWLKTESCIFVCNKWDCVPNTERRFVKQFTEDKIKKTDEFKECKVFMMSTLEADFIQKTTNGKLSPMFLTILQEIKRLIPIGRKNLVRKEYMYLEKFVGVCLYCIDTRLSNVGKSKAEKEKRHAEIEERLKFVAKDIKESFQKYKEDLKSQLGGLADNLQNHMKQKEIKEAVCKFTPKDLPKEKEWELAAVEVRQNLYLKIIQEINNWEENEHLFEKIAADVTKALTDEFPKFEKEISDVQCHIAGQTNRVSKDFGEEEVQFVPDFIQRFYQKIGLGAKIAIGIGLSPIFIVGILLRAPVYGFLSIRKSIGKFLFSVEFSRAKTNQEKIAACEEYARMFVGHICESVDFKEIINEDMQPMFKYIDNHRDNLENRIKADQALLKAIKKDIRSDDEIRQTFDPLKKTFEKLQSKIEDSKAKIKHNTKGII